MSATAQIRTTRRRRATAAKARASLRRVPPKGPELVSDEVQRRDEEDRGRLRGELSAPNRDQHMQHDEVRGERCKRDDEEAGALCRDPATPVSKGPTAVAEVVARDRDEERARRGNEIVDAGIKEARVHTEVDDVADRADDAELQELRPVL